MTVAQIELTSFDQPAVIGNQDITVPALSGIAVQGVLFYWVNDDPPGDADVIWGHGAATGPATSEQWAWCISNNDGTPATSFGTWDETKCIVINDPILVATTAEAAFVSFIDGGVRINWTKVAVVPPGRKIVAVFFAGSEVQCKCLTHVVTPDPLDLTNIGFKPDGVIGSNGQSSNTTGQSVFSGSFGWQDFQGPPENRLEWSPFERRMATTEARSLRLSAQEAANFDLSGVSGAFTVRYEDPDLSGMTARFDTSLGGQRFGAFAFKVPGKTVRAGNIDAPIVAGGWVVDDPGFRPDFVALMLTDLEVLDTVVQANLNWGVGLFTDTDEASLFASLEDGSTTPIAKSEPRVDRAAFLQDFVNGVTLFDGKFVTMTPTGWALNMSKVTNPPKKWGYLAIGEVDAAAAVEDVICEPDPWTS